MYEAFTPLAMQAVLEAGSNSRRRDPVLDSVALRRALLKNEHLDEVLRQAGCAPEDLLTEPDTSTVVPTNPGAVPFTKAVLDVFDGVAVRWQSVTTGRLLISLVDDLQVRPGWWEDAAPALALLSDPPATTSVSAHQIRLGPDE